MIISKMYKMFLTGLFIVLVSCSNSNTDSNVINTKNQNDESIVINDVELKEVPYIINSLLNIENYSAIESTEIYTQRNEEKEFVKKITYDYKFSNTGIYYHLFDEINEYNLFSYTDRVNVYSCFGKKANIEDYSSFDKSSFIGIASYHNILESVKDYLLVDNYEEENCTNKNEFLYKNLLIDDSEFYKKTVDSLEIKIDREKNEYYLNIDVSEKMLFDDLSNQSITYTNIQLKIYDINNTFVEIPENCSK